MTTKQKIMSYLKRCKTFKTTKTIAERTGCNYNTVRRCLTELRINDLNPWDIRRVPGDSRNEVMWRIESLRPISTSRLAA